VIGRLGLALGLGTFFAATRAGAELPADGEPIRTNRYSIDLYQGPVLASTRVTGLAGAFVAIAEGVDGNTQNPASPAVRSPYSRDHFDYDLGVGITFPSTISNTDFFNSGKRTDIGQPEQSGFVFLGIAVNLTFGRWGFGLTTDLQNYNLNRAEDASGAQGDQLNGQIAVGHLLLAHSFADGQLAVGVGARTLALDVNSQSARGDQTLFSTVGAGFETGFVWKPNDRQFRVGAAFRTAVNTEASPESQQRIVYRDDPMNELWLPDEVALPWDLNVGAAIQLGPRPLNPRFVDSNELTQKLRRYLAWRTRERERRKQYELSRGAAEGRDTDALRDALDAEASVEQALDDAALERAEQRADRSLVLRYASMERFFVLLTGSLLVSGAVEEAVGVESFLARRVQRSGEKISVSPRAAVETELIPRWTRVRGGSYYEPTRFSVNSMGDRVHVTFGLDQKLFPWQVFGLFSPGTEWRLSGALDAARGYFGWGIAIGLWH
jgi:hypothetical protein